MGIFDVFSKQARVDRAVARNVKKLTNKWVHMDERRNAITSLSTLGTDEAIKGLLLRFGFVIDNTTVDEEEKQRVADVLVDFGERSIGPVLEYVRKEDKLTWPLKVLSQLEEPKKVATHLMEILSSIHALDKKASERRVQLIHELAEIQDSRIADALIPLLEDDNEEVQFQSIETLELLGDEKAMPALVALAVREDSIRMRTRAIEAISRCGWSVAEHRDEFSPMLPANHYLDSGGHIKNRLDEILSGLKSDEARQRRFAARDATHLEKPEEAVDALIGALEDPDASVRAAVAAALAKVGDFRAVDPLQRLIDDPDADVRRKVGDALRKLR